MYVCVFVCVGPPGAVSVCRGGCGWWLVFFVFFFLLIREVFGEVWGRQALVLQAMGKIQIPPRPVDYFCVIGSTGGAVLDRAPTGGGASLCDTAAANDIWSVVVVVVTQRVCGGSRVYACSR